MQRVELWIKTFKYRVLRLEHDGDYSVVSAKLLLINQSAMIRFLGDFSWGCFIKWILLVCVLRVYNNNILFFKKIYFLII